MSLERLRTLLVSGALTVASACSDSTRPVGPNDHLAAQVVRRADGPYLVGPAVVVAPGLPVGHSPARARVLAQGKKQPSGQCGTYTSPEFYGARLGEQRRVFTIAEYDEVSCAAVFLLGDWQPRPTFGVGYDSLAKRVVVIARASIADAPRTQAMPPCAGVPDVRSALNRAWITANADGTEILRDEIRLLWWYNYYCIADAELTHFCAWKIGYNLFPGSSDQQGYYYVNGGYIVEVEARSFCGVRRNCPSPMTGYNEMSIGFGLGDYVSNIVRGFMDGAAVGIEPPYGINVPGSSCVIYATGFWEPPPPMA